MDPRFASHDAHFPTARAGERKSLLAGSKDQADAVDTIPLAASRRSIIKNMAQVGTTVLTEDLGAAHARGTILLIADGPRQRLIEARPATTGVKLS